MDRGFAVGYIVQETILYLFFSRLVISSTASKWKSIKMVPAIKKIIHSYTTSAWIPFLLVFVFLFIASILVISGGLHVKSPLSYSTKLFIHLYACSLLGQLYVSLCNFFGTGTKTGTIQLLLFIASLLFSFLTFFFLLFPFWKGFFGI